MGENSNISWTHHTFNPWWGCVEVSAECDNCYARTLAPPSSAVWPNKPIVDCYYWRRTDLLESDPSPIYYANFESLTPKPTEIAQRLVIENPVKLGFDPREAIRVDDSKEHECISFRSLWSDLTARTIWLSHKRFMLTDQCFRLRCVQNANYLRRTPEYLLGERVSFRLSAMCGLWNQPWQFELGAQAVPYLIYALQRERRWPFLSLPAKKLEWKVVVTTEAS